MIQQAVLLSPYLSRLLVAAQSRKVLSSRLPGLLAEESLFVVLSMVVD